jgi:chaperonin cofactor prefoldin
LAETKNIFDLYDTEDTGQKQLETMLMMVAEKKQQLEQQLLDINAVMNELEDLEQNCKLALAKYNQQSI